MKGKRFAALAMALVMTLSLLTVSAGAVSFADMVGHWAREDVEYLAGQGVVNGTGATTFSPDRKMTACEALLLCSRATGVTAADKMKIYADWSTRVKALLPADMISWASEEMAVCLATGIITEQELKTLTSTGDIARSISRESLARYLVRAMQLAPLAESLSSYGMSFSDASSISASYKPYVYLLNTYGVVRGDQANRFLPQGSLTRAEMATMLRRAIDFMDERGIYAELAEYTDYEWLGGTISAVSAGGSGVTLLTLDNEAAGVRSISLPANTDIYENNMFSTTSALKVGQYVRVNLNNKGTAYSVRVGGALTAYSGTITSLDEEQVVLNISGLSKTLKIDRFTEIQVGRKSGGRELIDSAADYTQAVCRVDEQGHLAQIQLSGGSSGEAGILTGVAALAGGGQTLQVTGFDGVTRQYTLPAGAEVTVNGAAGSITARHVGNYVDLRVSNDGVRMLDSVAVDTVTEYVQGSLKTYSTSSRYDTATITSLSTGKSTTYDVAVGAVIRYEGVKTDLDDLKKNCFVTACISKDEITLLEAYPASSETEGELVSISYGTPTVLSVRTKGEEVVAFNLDLTDLPSIYRDDKTSSIDKLKPGDNVIITVRYNEVETIDAYSQTANVAGTISRITMESSGVTLDVLMTSGETVSYRVSDTVSVTQDGTAISIYALKPNYKISMVVSGENVVSIEVDKSTATSNMLSGTVLVPNLKEYTLMIKLASGAPVTVDVAYANFMTANGYTTYLDELEIDDVVQIYGSYSGATFVATLVIVL